MQNSSAWLVKALAKIDILWPCKCVERWHPCSFTTWGAQTQLHWMQQSKLTLGVPCIQLGRKLVSARVQMCEGLQLVVEDPDKLPERLICAGKGIGGRDIDPLYGFLQLVSHHNKGLAQFFGSFIQQIPVSPFRCQGRLFLLQTPQIKLLSLCIISCFSVVQERVVGVGGFRRPHGCRWIFRFVSRNLEIFRQ